jgi:ATP-dependent Zn protease
LTLFIEIWDKIKAFLTLTKILEVFMEQKRIIRKRYTAWLSTELLDLIEDTYKDDNCRTKNEYVEKALWFYSGYLADKNNQEYIASAVRKTVESIVEKNTNRLSSLIFNQAVELATVENILAVREKIDKTTLDRLRGKCVEEVKRLNGQFDFTDAMLWQHGDF